jgi:hypothetical protein
MVFLVDIAAYFSEFRQHLGLLIRAFWVDHHHAFHHGMAGLESGREGRVLERTTDIQ